jgi:hypothetical protein
LLRESDLDHRDERLIWFETSVVTRFRALRGSLTFQSQIEAWPLSETKARLVRIMSLLDSASNLRRSPLETFPRSARRTSAGERAAGDAV